MMSELSAVLLVFVSVFASGLTVRMIKRANDEADTGTFNFSDVDTFSDIEYTHEPMVNSSAKKAFTHGDRLLNRIKERSVVKIIKKCKRPRYRLRESILENDLFSRMKPEVSSSTGVFPEIYSPPGRSENYVSVKPAPTQSGNKSDMANKLNTQKNSEFINTYIPKKYFVNDSDIEIIRNTILRLNAIPNNPNFKSPRRDLQKPVTTKPVKHRVRKYFRLHSANVKQLIQNPRKSYSNIIF